ncbi:MAG: NAD(P)H-dependent flavin oxidoreductase [Candidatus Cyclobacteriaceae bacterium M3_2C_046]
MQKDTSQSTPSNVEKLLRKFELKYPIFQAPAGGPAGEALAIAVAKAGGMGSLAMTWNSAEEAKRKAQLMNQATNGNYFFNYVLHFEPKSLDSALEAGLPIVQFSFGIPDRQITSKVKAAGCRLGIQVTSKRNALQALERNPDFLICQGIEAGGHVQSHLPLKEGLAQVLEIAGEVPVLASGGITTGMDLKIFTALEAAGAVMGTRFLATRESRAHDAYKKVLVKAEENSTELTVCFDKGWTNAPHRIIKNNTYYQWEAAGCPAAGNRPGEKDVVASRANGDTIERYATSCPVEGNSGNVLDLALYAGTGVAKIHDLPSVEILLKRIGKEYLTTP